MYSYSSYTASSLIKTRMGIVICRDVLNINNVMKNKNIPCYSILYKILVRLSQLCTEAAKSYVENYTKIYKE
jgi:hypothetical protein